MDDATRDEATGQAGGRHTGPDDRVRSAARRRADTTPAHAGSVDPDIAHLREGTSDDHTGEIIATSAPDGWHGVRVATVVDVVDPEGQGRVEVLFPPPEPPGRAVRTWAEVATLMAGPDRGTWFVPDVGDRVVVAFQFGDTSSWPIILGCLWNDDAPRPAEMDANGDNDVRLIRSRAGTVLEFNDSTDAGVTLRTAGGAKVELDEGAGRITVDDGAGQQVVVDETGITIDAAATIRITSDAVVEVAAGLVTVDAAMAQFSGVVQAETVIATNVVAPNITPAAGNIW